MITRRSAFAVFAAAFAAPVVARAQAGAIPSTTAPSNSQGTPGAGGTGGTGVVSTTQVPAAGGASATPHKRRRHRTRKHHATSGQ